MFAAVNFHYIRENYDYPIQAIHGTNPVSFRKQLELLAKEGLFVSQEEVCRAVTEGYPLPNNSILITFDDGLKEQFDLALPILQEMGIPAIFFINPYNIIESKISLVHQVHLLRSFVPAIELLSKIDDYGININLTSTEKKLAQDHYNYDQESDALLKYFLNFKLQLVFKDSLINQLFQDCFSLDEIEKFHDQYYMDLSMVTTLDHMGLLGSHTYSHQPLGLLPDIQLFEEFQKANQFFSDYGLTIPKSVSYPFGNYESCSLRVQEIAEKFNFNFGFTMERAGNQSVVEKPLYLARFDCNDVVGGKSSIFQTGKMFETMKIGNWKF